MTPADGAPVPDWHSPMPAGFRWPEGVRAAACFTFDLDAEVTRSSRQMAKLFERAQLRQNILVSALGSADCPGAADILGSGGQGIVGTLAVDASDRMDGRKVQHIESHAGQVG